MASKWSKFAIVTCQAFPAPFGVIILIGHTDQRPLLEMPIEARIWYGKPKKIVLSRDLARTTRKKALTNSVSETSDFWHISFTRISQSSWRPAIKKDW